MNEQDKMSVGDVSFQLPQSPFSLALKTSTFSSEKEQDHFIKYLLKELATSGTFKNSVLVLQRKISSLKINEKISDYAKEFVLCKQCGKPDTELTKDKDFLFMHCLACGAKHSVRARL